MSSSNQNNSGQNLERILFDGLNEHGFIFQEKCAEELRKNVPATKWRLLGKEYPVDSNGRSTRIDIILSDTTDYYPIKHQLLAIVECKRVSLERGYWLFGKPISPISGQSLILWLQAGSSDENHYISWTKQKCDFHISSPLVDNWWLQINKKGSQQKYESSPQPIENSFLQTFAGVSGMAQEMYENVTKKDPKECSILFVPVIITTAPLYYAGYDLNDVDLASGYIDKGRVFFGEPNKKPEELEWIQVNYPVSRSTFPEDFGIGSTTSLLSGLRKDYQSSIFVVNSNHIVKFFSRLHLS
jgi:hypothetical protein